MTKLLLLLSLWPFHHKKPDHFNHTDRDISCECVEPYVPHLIECDSRCTWLERGDGQIDQSKSGPIGRCGAILEDCISEPKWSPGHTIEQPGDGYYCDEVDDLYFYTGDDKMTGISGASCEGAKDNWRTLHIDPVRMSRS